MLVSRKVGFESDGWGKGRRSGDELRNCVLWGSDRARAIGRLPVHLLFSSNSHPPSLTNKFRRNSSRSPRTPDQPPPVARLALNLNMSALPPQLQNNKTLSILRDAHAGGYAVSVPSSSFLSFVLPCSCESGEEGRRGGLGGQQGRESCRPRGRGRQRAREKTRQRKA